jgi:hypothetical protein
MRERECKVQVDDAPKLRENSGPGAFHSYRKSGNFQKFWTSCISFIQKIWGIPEILEQLYFIHTENLGGFHQVKFHSYKKSWAF